LLSLVAVAVDKVVLEQVVSVFIQEPSLLALFRSRLGQVELVSLV
jgi:hypothetical protein